MGQKVNPTIFRLGINKLWHSVWYSNKKNFVNNLKNDYLIRNFIFNKLNFIPISKIIIERLVNNVIINIYSSRPGAIIGKKGKDLDILKNKLNLITKIKTKIVIFDVKKPELDSKLVSENICYQIKKRVSYKKVIKRHINNIIKLGSLGIKIRISGRLNGSDIARSETYKEGRIPLHTLRSDIDYYSSISKTSYGIIGVKVWIFKGNIYKK